MEPITARTTLIEALAHDEGFYRRFVTANGVFRRLAGAVMREDTASRLSIAEVAAMGGIRLAEVLPETQEGGAPDLVEAAPALLEEPVATLDARPLLQDGHEPLPAILDFVAGLPAGASFAVEAPFEPKPLRRLFAARGYESAARALTNEHWRVVFRRLPAENPLP